jgi:hypothetical protein
MGLYRKRGSQFRCLIKSVYMHVFYLFVNGQIRVGYSYDSFYQRHTHV